MKRGFSVIGFTVAVTLFVLNIVSVNVVPAVLIGTAALFITSLILPDFRKNTVVPLCFGSALFACVLFITVYYSSAAVSFNLDGKEALTSFYITDFPKCTNEGYVYTAKAIKIIKNGAPQGVKIRIKSESPIYSEAYHIINGNLKFASIGDSAFQSYGYWGKNIFLTSRINDYSTTDVIVNPVMLKILNLRKDISDMLCECIKGDAGAFAAAVITGDRSRLSQEAVNAFKIAGISHLTAISGLHLSIITGCVYYILSKLKVNEKVNSVIMILFVLFYCALTGFTSSVVRAGIMLVTLLAGRVINRRTDTLNSLGFAVFIMCLNPFAVCDVGAVLSVTAVLAIITAYPAFTIYSTNLLNKIFKKRNTFSFVSKKSFVSAVETVSLPAAVLLYTMPVLYLFFGYYSFIGLLINCIAVPLGSLSTVLSFLVYFANKAHILPSLFNFADRTLNNFILKLVYTASSFKYATVNTESVFGIVISGMLIIFAFCCFLGNKKFIKYAAVITVIAIAVTSVCTVSTEKKNARLLICKSGACAVISDGSVFVSGIDSYYDYYDIFSFLLTQTKKIDTVVISEKKAEYAVLLSKRFDCDKIITPRFSNEIISDGEYKFYEVSEKTNIKVGKSISYSMIDTAKYKNFKMKIKNTNIVFSKKPYDNNSIFVAKETVYDYNGIIDTSKSNVIYNIYDNNTYNARRVNVWEN